MKAISPRTWLILGLVGHLLFQFWPAWQEVQKPGDGRDFASYYYAEKVAMDGRDPYLKSELNAHAWQEKTRREVFPYLYPPPFLLTMVWTRPLSLLAAYRLMLFLNEALLAGCLWVMHRGFGIRLPWIALLLCCWTPISGNGWMGQANFLALLPALAGMAWAPRAPIRGGILVATAAMIKMSPVVLLVHLGMRRNWWALTASLLGAVGLSVLTLPLLHFPMQLNFYREILPAFGSGNYNGLSVPLDLPSNHSLPQLFQHFFPSGDGRLSPTARLLSQLSLPLGLLAYVAWFRRIAPQREALAIGALLILAVITPTYTWEHHLSLLLLPVAAVGQYSRGLTRALFFFAFAWLAMPFHLLELAQQGAPSFLLRESKLLSMLLLLGLCAALASPTAEEPAVRT